LSTIFYRYKKQHQNKNLDGELAHQTVFYFDDAATAAKRKNACIFELVVSKYDNFSYCLNNS